MSRFVLDASTALGWVVDDPPSSFATHVMQRLLAGDRGLVPSLWHLELANWFAVAQRKNVLDEPAVVRCLQAVDDIVAAAVDTEIAPFHMRKILDRAHTFQLSAYDAVYLDLALREGLPLATLDRPLRAAATKAGIETFE